MWVVGSGGTAWGTGAIHFGSPKEALPILFLFTSGPGTFPTYF